MTVLIQYADHSVTKYEKDSGLTDLHLVKYFAEALLSPRKLDSDASKVPIQIVIQWEDEWIAKSL